MNFFQYFNQNYVEMRFGISFILTDVFFSLGLAIILGAKIRLDSVKHFFIDIGFRVLQIAAVWALGIFLCCLIYYFTGYSTTYNQQVVIPLQIVFFALAFSRSRLIIRMVFSLFYYSVFICSLSMSAWVGTFMRETFPAFTASVPVAAIVQGIFIAACAILALMSKVKRYEKIDKVSAGLLLLVATTDTAIYLIGISVGYYDSGWTLALMGLLFSELIVFFMFSRNTRHTNELLYLYTEKERSQKMKEIAEVVKADIEKLKTIRHDLKNSYTYMSMLSEEGKYDELNAYLKKNSLELYDSVTFAVCGNFVIDHILALEMGKAQPKNIAIEYNIAVAPVLAAEDSDLCHLLLNLIDNAIEAIDRGNFEGDKRKVTVNMSQNGNIVFVRVLNPAPASAQDGLVEKLNSSKEGEYHGYGLKIVKKTVRKYNGTVRCMIKDGMFIAEAVLFMDMQAGNNKEE